MGNTLYLECYSGISGDMTVAALLDLGADEKVLFQVLESLPVKGFEAKISKVKKSGIAACDFNVILNKAHENHDHDMQYLYGHLSENYTHEAVHDNHHEAAHDHHHEHAHSRGHHTHHEHRGMKEITDIIRQGDMTEHARELALKIFHVLAMAESKAHGIPVEEVHFHEVGAVDSIVDIIAVAVCMDNLCIENVVVPLLYEGKGTVRCQHGILPIPVPAVLHIMKDYHLPVKIMDMQGEFITPTGAAIVAATRTMSELPESFVVEKIGIGAGKRVYDGPGIMRALLISSK